MVSSHYRPISFPKLKGEIKVDVFCKNLVEQKEVMLLPSTVYGFDENSFRIGFARRNLKEGLEILANFIKLTMWYMQSKYI